MRLVCVTRAYGSGAGGMERLSYELTSLLERQYPGQVEVIVYKGQRLFAPFFAFTVIPRLLRSARQADAIHLGDPLLAFPGWLVSRLYGKPVALTVHGLDLLYSNLLYRLYLRLFADAFALYLPISNYAADILRARHVAGKITVLPPGINDTWYEPALQRQDLSIVIGREITDRQILFTSGRLVKRKGVAWFVGNVLPRLPKSVLYVIVGNGPMRDEIERVAKEKGVMDQILLLGRVPESTLRVLYNTADAFIQPNIRVHNDGEGFGLVLIEAALCGRPVFAANLEGIPDAIQAGKNGTLLPPEKSEAWVAALQTFINNSDQYKPDARSSREYTLQHFSWFTLTSRYVEVFNGLLNSAPN